MAYTTLKELFTAICDAIRAKKGTTEEINHQDIAAEIDSIRGEDTLNALLTNTLTNYSNEEVATIKNYLFAETSIKSVDFPNVEYVGISAFENCENLTSVNIPNATYIDDSAFYYAISLLSIELPKVTEIGTYAFKECENLQNVDIPIVTKVGAGAFHGAYAKTVNAPLIETIGKQAFQSTHLTTFDFANVTEVGQKAFAYSNLTEAILPAMKKVGTDAFNQCFQLVNVDIPNVTEIDAAGFCECTSLKTINMPNVTKLNGYYVFMYDRSLEAIVLPANTVCYLGHTSTFNQSSIANGTAYVYVPDDLVEDYKVATNWSTYADQIKPLSEYVEG